MKRLMLIGSVFFCLLFATVKATAQSNMSGIKKSLTAGDANTLSSFLASTVDVTINGDDDTYDKSKASTRLRAFFENHSPSGFTIKHEGNAPNGSKFIVGNLRTNEGSFRTYIVIRNNKIHEISFED